MEEQEVPVPKSGQLLIKVCTVGICGTDISFWTRGEIGPFKPSKPMVMGHECSGVVSGLGPDVHGFTIGDRVAIEPGVPCRKCEFCKRGRYNLCHKMEFFSLPPTDGAMRRFVAVDADYCFKIPDTMTMEEASFLEPLSVGLHVCRKAKIGIGNKVLVLGAGPVGLVSMMIAKATNATVAAVTDILDHRLKIAKEVGADETVNVKGLSATDAAKMIEEKIGGAADVVIECCGAQASIELAIKAVKDGGKVMLVALGAEYVNIPILEVVAKEVTVHGVIKYSNTWPAAIELIRSGKIQLDKLTTAHYKLEEAVEAFKFAQKGEVTKVFINCGS
uniref:Sorbitol dehydrogenase n=1 Tax=Setaria digitata TaxID=48799 RepID=A0A915PGE6_9BILA